ncbi:hypothetical protein [Microbulbifer sp. HZ11]|uniref:hypothetical protein n=1 Tax=Microbulbifer sp. HZ11 TaxID=1453501 RepID=UPI0005B9D2D5|nr:hypothetical protein [Microbulbifer sp. HZ11]
MTLKELAHAAQQHLQSSVGFSLKKSHIYELLAASIGFNSYAAFKSEMVFTLHTESDNPIPPKAEDLPRRFIELGYPSETATLAASGLQAFLAVKRVGAVNILDLINSMRDEFSIYSEYLDASDVSPFDYSDPDWANTLLLNGLEKAAAKDNGNANYALALIYSSETSHWQVSEGSAYWFEQVQQGRTLAGTEKEWADAYETSLNRAMKHKHHLREAGRQSVPLALLDLAAKFGDPTFFDQSYQNVDVDPAEIAAIAEQIGHTSGAKYWLTIAAECGNTEAMLELIEAYDREDLVRSWSWVYLSQLVGTDLSKSAHYAIHEDGSLYDDDIGGPMFVDGRDGVELDPISSEQHAEAKRTAEILFERIQHQGN